MNQGRQTIRQLSPAVINKIAAGEVIERPASVVKELLENAVDSGANRIEARLEKGGCDRVRVSDNGCGIPESELMLALASHATSKIEDADDLFAVTTLGFRGEALASIAEVSHLTLRSRINDSPTAFEVAVRGGRAGQASPCASAPGTTVDVRNLFFNTPVRRKFMRTVPTELGHANEAFIRIALANPQVHFTLTHNDRVVHDLPAVDQWRQRIAKLFGDELCESLMWVESQDRRIKLTGYVANPTHSRSNNKMQYLFLNGRHIKDRSLQHALGEAYRGLLLTGRFPIAFLKFELPAEQIDVNVHPTKLEVRFQDAGTLYSQLLSTIRGEFLATDLTARVDTKHHPPTPPPHPSSATEPSSLSAAQAQRQRKEIQDWARQAPAPERSAAGRNAQDRTDENRADRYSVAPNRADQQSTFRFDLPHANSWDALPRSSDADSDRPLETTALGSGSQDRATSGTTPRDAASQRAPEVSGPPARSVAARYAVEATQALQAHNRYLVTASDEGLTVIDQHALHERILYEQLREKVLARTIERQRLLVPEPIDLSPSEAAAVLDHQTTLAELGIDIEDFGGSTILVQSYPAMLGGVDPQELVRQLAMQLADGHRLPEKRDVLDELLHMCSCKAAVKAGDPLTSAEISALLEFRHLVQDSHHCPHGRPTTLVFTRQELDRRFKRI